MNGVPRRPSYPSRGPTPANAPPAQYGAPVAFDEETEIATLAEIERDIYVGMEKLEDAFEALHQKAETVRKAIRERSAGLAAAAQRRRGLGWSPEVRGDTPASLGASVNGEQWDAETDDGVGSGRQCKQHQLVAKEKTKTQKRAKDAGAGNRRR